MGLSLFLADLSRSLATATRDEHARVFGDRPCSSVCGRPTRQLWDDRDYCLPCLDRASELAQRRAS